MEYLRPITVMSIDIAPIEHVAAANAGAREATERAVTKWMLAHGHHWDHPKIVMLSVVECSTGRPVATGFGLSELTACNALLADLTERCRGMMGIRRMSKAWRDQMRTDAGEARAEKSREFLMSRKSGKSNTSDRHVASENISHSNVQTP